jgi:hypothetical protein
LVAIAGVTTADVSSRPGRRPLIKGAASISPRVACRPLLVFEFGPGAVVGGRVGVQQEAEDLIAGREAGHFGAGVLDGACVVAPERDGVLVLDAHTGKQAGRDRAVDRIDRGGVYAHEHLVGGGSGFRQILARAGLGVGLVERDGSHVGLLSGAVRDVASSRACDGRRGA